MTIREFWCEVPGTGGRLEVSNLGHLKVGQDWLPLEYDGESATHGWTIERYGERRFVPRMALMALFLTEGIAVKADTDSDEAAKENFIADSLEELNDLKAKIKAKA